jgi:hypothetical protein
MLILISCLQFIIFGSLWYYYFINPLFKCPCKKYFQGFPIAKASATLININIFMILIILSKTYKKFIYIKINTLKKIHIYLGSAIIFWSTIHSISHYINFIKSNMPKLLITSGSGLTGNFLILFFVLLLISTRVQNSSIFYIIHNISTIIIIFMVCIHGTFCTIKYNINTCPESSSWKWLLSGIIISFIEIIYKYSFSTYTNGIIKYSDNLYEFSFNLPKQYCGKLIWLNIPAINKFEWHPFTVSSYNKFKYEVTVHIKCKGDWTNKIINYIYYNNKNKLKVKIDGPYHCLSKNFSEKLLKEPTLLITSGIGITTFSYNLQKISNEKDIFKLYLIIILKNPNEIDWFLPILKLLFDKNNFYVLFYFTEKHYYDKLEIDFPFNYNLGRPNFKNILDDIFIHNLFNTTDSLINIFYSGNNVILKDLRNITKNNKTFKLQNF